MMKMRWFEKSPALPLINGNCVIYWLEVAATVALGHKR